MNQTKVMTLLYAYRWIIASLVVCAVGLYGMVAVFLHGQESVYGVTREVPWGVLIAGYALLIAASAGTFLVSSLGFLFGFSTFDSLQKRGVLLAITSLIGGFWLLFWDLGGPYELQILRFIRYFYPFHLTSPVWWMGFLLVMYAFLLFVQFFFTLTGHKKLAFTVSIFTFVAAVFALGNLGSEFSYDITREFWNGPFLPLFFIISALVSGAVTTILLTYFSPHARPEAAKNTLSALSKLMVLFLGILLFFHIWKMLTSVYGHPPMKYEAALVLLKGQLSFNFWFFEIGVGVALPALLLFLSRFRSPTTTLLAAVLVAVGIYYMRYDMVYAGQIVSVTSGYLPHVHYALYTPSWSELTLVISAFGIVAFLYFVGEKYLNLNEEASHEQA
jgi:Ni/Fe-hydrogenase subunit HybB-like protein